MTSKSDHDHMRRAIDLAHRGMHNKIGGPFGAVVVKDGVIIGEGSNSVTSIADPTAHAEIQAVRSACENLGTFSLEGAAIYTTCEPCPMCYAAIFWARINDVVYASDRADAAAAGFDDSVLWNEFGGRSKTPRLVMRRIDDDGAKRLFAEWRAMPDKTPY